MWRGFDLPEPERHDAYPLGLFQILDDDGLFVALEFVLGHLVNQRGQVAEVRLDALQDQTKWTTRTF